MKQDYLYLQISDNIAQLIRKEVLKAGDRLPSVRTLCHEHNISMGLAARAQKEASERTERMSRQMLHTFNLPAGSDVNRLLTQIAKLEREVRELRKQLDDQKRGTYGPARKRARQDSA